MRLVLAGLLGFLSLAGYAQDAPGLDEAGSIGASRQQIVARLGPPLRESKSSRGKDVLCYLIEAEGGLRKLVEPDAYVRDYVFTLEGTCSGVIYRFSTSRPKRLQQELLALYDAQTAEYTRQPPSQVAQFCYLNKAGNVLATISHDASTVFLHLYKLEVRKP